MKKLLILSCEDLTGHICDDDLWIEEINKGGIFEVETRPWNHPTDWSKFNLVIVRTTWDYHKTPEKFLKTLLEIENAGCLLLNSYKIIKWNHHKTYLRDLELKGVKTIPTEYIDANSSLDKIQAFFKNNSQEKYILKPAIGATASGIKIIEKDFFHSLNKELFNECDTWLLQPFIDQIYAGEKSFHYFNKKFSHAILKIPKSGDFRVQEEHGGNIIAYEPTSSELEVASAILARIPDQLLYARVDMIDYKNSLHLMELELIEPALYFRINKDAARKLVSEIHQIP
jgi:glutathione synthase/RimK-type ligase-like ATP-grasp enzyme